MPRYSRVFSCIESIFIRCGVYNLHSTSLEIGGTTKDVSLSLTSFSKSALDCSLGGKYAVFSLSS